jgi:hypothetical protein
MGNTNRISALVLLAGAGFVGFEAWRLNIWSGPGVPGAGFLPLLLAMGLAAGAVGVFLEGALTGRDGTRWFDDRASALRLLVLTGCIAAMAAAIPWLGMLPAVGLFLLVFLAVYLRGRWMAVLLIAGVTPFCLHLIFERWLKFTLPRGFLGF